MKNYYARKLKEDGYEVQIEAPRGDGYADIIATKAGKTHISEIETGTSDFVKNLRQGLLSADKVVIVATNDRALKLIERNLTKENLLNLSKIEITLKK